MNQNDHWDFTRQEWGSPYFSQILEKAFEKAKKPFVVYDIGANVGAWGSIVLEHFPVRSLVSFEPDGENFAFLESKLTDNRCVNINKGVYYGMERAAVHGRGDGNCGGYFIEGLEPFGKKGMDLRKVFELCELESMELPKPDIIKIDVEGAEKNILEHSKIVKQCKNIIIEWHYTEKAEEFFARHLPKHSISVNLEGLMYLLQL